MPKYKGAKGFTLIEAIAVLIIIAIAAAVAISREASSADAELKSAAEALKGHIRYAQMRALNSDAPNCNASVGMVMSGVSYSMFSITGSDCTGAPISLPGAESSGVALPAGMTVAATPATFYFDRWGRPYLDAVCTEPSATITIDISSNAGPAEITITKNTGFVP